MSERYALSQRLIHWAVALSVIFALAVGLTLGRLGFDGVKATFGMEVTNVLYKYHKTFGVLILAMMALRVLLKLRLGKPAYSEPLPAFQRVASEAVHGLLYVALLSMPILGWAATASAGYPVEFFNWKLPGLIGKHKELSETLYSLHRWLGWTIGALVLVHISAAIYHWRVRRDGVIERMRLI